MTSTAPSAASPGTTDGPPVPYAIQAVLQLANRLDEEAGWRDVSSLRKRPPRSAVTLERSTPRRQTWKRCVLDAWSWSVKS